MSATSGHQLATARSHTVARQRRLRRTLETYGVLTHDGLRDLVGARCWSTPFETVLSRAVRSGRVRRLGDDFYEAGPTP
jgi:hypothetical protein